MATMVPCNVCLGTGLVERPVAEVAAKVEWVRPLFARECCTKCGGGGKVPLDPKTVKE